MAKMKAVDHPMMKGEFDMAMKDLRYEMKNMSLELSRQITREIIDSYWKLIPITIGLMAVTNGIFFIAYKLS